MQKIEHAGYQRYIISRNPPLLDDDGDEIDEEEFNNDDGDDNTIVDENPYSEIKLDRE